VVLGFGNPTGSGAAALYTQNGNFYTQVFNQTYGGNPVTLLTGGAYINFHSKTYPAGEIRGQVFASTETLNTRILNASSLGTVSASGAVTSGFIVSGPQPVLALITARGPSLSQFGVANVLSNPALSVYGPGGVLMATNVAWGTAADPTTIAASASLPLQTNDSALLLVLPPGSYTAQITSAVAGGTGAALLEIFDARTQ
jgi:hypothetical protein